MQDLMAMRVRVNHHDEGNGTSSRNTAEGRWVNTIVLIRPILLAMAEAKTLERAERNQVIDSTEPNSPWEGWNLVLRK
jgi:hypothetical protein